MNTQKLVFRIQLAAAAVLVCLCLVVAGSLRERIVAVGDSAPNFQVTTEDGRRISTSDFGGKILVLNFWATWCPPCVEEMPSLQAMAQRLGPHGVVVLGVSVDQNPAAYKRFLQRARVTFKTSRDPEASISADYGTFKYPETYIIDRTGKVRQKVIGPQDWMDPDVLHSIESLL